jgi:hypothetical protein
MLEFEQLIVVQRLFDPEERQELRYWVTGCTQVEAGLDDLRAAYAELHQQLDSGTRPPEEKERLSQHVRPTLFTGCLNCDIALRDPS